MKNTSITLIALAIAAVVAYFLGAQAASIHPALLAVAVIFGGVITLLFSGSRASSEENVQVDSEPSAMEREDSQTLYVGNLPYRANETAIRELFSEHGTVVSVRLLKDKQTGKRRGFGFVEMAEDDAEAAIEALNEQEFQQRTLKVRMANERKPNN